MSETESTEVLFADRTGWPAGPWDKEPDRVEWRHAGLPCLIVRGSLGALCGYVGVAPDHPLHGVAYDDAPVEAHGGLTYSDRCAGHICHVPQPGEPADVWWLGFDCAHAFDLVPRIHASLLAHGGGHLIASEDFYRDVAYVTAEVNDLAEQLARLGSPA